MKFIILLFLASSFTVSNYCQEPSIGLHNLRCELLVNPLGIDVTSPALSWELQSDQRNVQQTGWQILVSTSREKLARDEGDLWNSGKVSSDRSVQVLYNGKSLESRTTCFWKVKCWTTKGETGWSQPAHFSMGLLSRSEWKARWIGLDSAFAWDSVSQFARLSARYFRKEFKVQKEIRRASVYIAGLGLYELHINGKKIGDQVLAPVPTDYSKSVLYNAFDVTNALKSGTNVVGTVLGNGRFFAMRQKYKPQKWHTFGYPKMILQLELEFTDGTKQVVISDETWKVISDGPIRSNNEYDGEEFDARKVLSGWQSPGYNAGNWLPAKPVKSPGGTLRSQMTANMKVMETIRPVSISRLRGNTHVLDMGQNIAGWLRIKVRGKRGTRIVLRFAETLQADGELFTKNLRDAKVTDIYTLSGEGEEVWEPSFVYHGFRYVEVTGFPGEPSIENFEGRVVYDEMRTVGNFETSNSTLNGIHRNAYWGIRGNYKGMPVDCPQRNERQPWLGDRSTGAYGETFLFDNGALYAKWLDDIKESQTAEGSIPDVAPNFWFYYKDNMTWPGTYLMVADMLYRQYGDSRPIARHYPYMQKWLTYMQRKYMKNFIVAKDSYGDWCVPPESPEIIRSRDPNRITDGALIGTAYYYYLLSLMQNFARLLDKTADEREFCALSDKIKHAFQEKFYNPGTGGYSNNTVTANLLPLRFGITPANLRHLTFESIVDKIVRENRYHISTGVIGTQWLMRSLSDHGQAELAYRLASNRTYPSWGYMLANDATTIWELWNGNTADPGMNSGNHVMLLGDLMIWFYENLAGIKSDTVKTGFKEIEMKPVLPDSLQFVNASYHSVHGLIASSWKKQADKLVWAVTIPVNTKAKLYLPTGDIKNIREGNSDISESKDARVVGKNNDHVVIQVGSGNYTFIVDGINQAGASLSTNAPTFSFPHKSGSDAEHYRIFSKDVISVSGQVKQSLKSE